MTLIQLQYVFDNLLVAAGVHVWNRKSQTRAAKPNSTCGKIVKLSANAGVILSDISWYHMLVTKN